MQYLMLIYTNEQVNAERFPTDEAHQAHMMEYFAFNEAAKEKGVFCGGQALQAIDTATAVRVRDGKTLATDGPFAETKEQLGGYYLLECEDLDQAIEWAAKIPASQFGTIEVRPLLVLPTMG